MFWQTRTQQRRERQEDSRFCFLSVALAAATFVAFVALLAICLTDPAGTPLLPYLVDLGANSLFLFALLTACLASLGHSWLAVIWSLKGVWRLFLVQLLTAGRIPPTHIPAPAGELRRWLLSVRDAAAQLLRRLVIHPPLLSPKSKAPFLLFQQAPLLTAP